MRSFNFQGIRYFMVGAIVLSLILLVLLAAASANTTFLAEYYHTLLILNGGMIALLVSLVILQFLQLHQQLKRGTFGAKLTRRLVVLFALVAVIPGILVYGVSFEFIASSIESWFDVKIDRALNGGVNLGRSAFDFLLQDVNKKGEYIANTLSDLPNLPNTSNLNRIREGTGIEELALFNQRGQLLAFAGGDLVLQGPEPPSSAMIRKARLQQSQANLEQRSNGEWVARVLLPVNINHLGEPSWILQVVHPIPKPLQEDAEIVQQGAKDYQSLSFTRSGLKKLYGLTLTLALLLALFTALTLAFFLSEKISQPLGSLAEGTRAVANGDFTYRQPVRSRDELGILTESFNAMTTQLADASVQAEKNRRTIEATNAYLQGILKNLSAGVITFDHRLRLRSANPGAAVIVQQDLQLLVDKKPSEWSEVAPGVANFAYIIQEGFQTSQDGQWQRQAEVVLQEHPRALLFRGTRLANEATDGGYILVFDDLTELMQAQRDAAWSEVARRLAHEIKNPLTPIQLSAERLQLKLLDKLAGTDTEVLKRGTQTIISQVSAMKSMVDDFSLYARQLRPGSLNPLNFNNLLVDVLGLYENQAVKITLHLTKEDTTIHGEPTRLRQVIHNLLQNALEAMASRPLNEEPPPLPPEITITTAIQGNELIFQVQDNGPGFPPDIISKAFEPYVTGKPGGTGLGLAIVKKITEEHTGRAALQNQSPLGALVTLTFLLTKNQPAQTLSTSA